MSSTEKVFLPDETLRDWKDQLDPSAPVGPDSPLYVDLDVHGLRGSYDLERLIEPIKLSRECSCQLFSGFAGTGKSSELRRLKKLLEADGYTVLLADARDYHTLSRDLIIEDFLGVLAGSFGAETDKLVPSRSKLVKDYFSTLLQTFKAELKLDEMNIAAGPTDLKLSLHHDKPLWQEVREQFKRSPGRQRQETHDYVRECIARLEKAFPQQKGVVFILDSLEQLRSLSSTTRAAVMDSAVNVFANSSFDLKLPCHVIYTVPPYLSVLKPDLKTLYDRQSVVLPAIKIEERPKDPENRSRAVRRPLFGPGISALKAVLGKRLPLERIFAAESDLLETLIFSSGGHIRTLIAMMKELVFEMRRHGLPLEEKSVAGVITIFGEGMRSHLFREYVPLLDRLFRTGTLEDLSKDELSTVASLMDQQLVLCYRNDDVFEWYDVHPLVREALKTRVVRLRRRKAPQGDDSADQR